MNISVEDLKEKKFMFENDLKVGITDIVSRFCGETGVQITAIYLKPTYVHELGRPGIVGVDCEVKVVLDL